MKGSGSSQPGNCSTLLPPLAFFPHPFLVVPCSMAFYSALLLEEGEGKRLGFPIGFCHPIPIHSQRPCRLQESDLTSPAVFPQHVELCSMLSHPKPLGSWQGSLQWAGEPWANPCCWGAAAYLPAVETELECSPPSLLPHHHHPLSSELSLCIPQERGRPDSSDISPDAGTGWRSCPSALGCTGHLGTAPLLQGKYPNKTAHGFLLLLPHLDPNLKQDFSNQEVPPGK